MRLSECALILVDQQLANRPTLLVKMVRRFEVIDLVATKPCLADATVKSLAFVRSDFVPEMHVLRVNL